LSALKDIVGIDYPTEALLESAISGKLRSAILPCPANVSITENKFNDDEFKALLEFLGDKKQLVAELRKFRQQTTICDASDLGRVKEAIKQVFEIVLPRLKKQAQFAVQHKNPPVYKDRHPWKSETCSCLLDTLSGQIIGFYPFWLDLHQKTLNFGLLSRINLYGLTFDEQGNFTNATNNTAPRWPADFFGAAKKYGTAVDWVIYKNDWKAWSKLQNKEKKIEVMDNLVANIVKLLSGKLNADVLTNAGDDQTAKGDGVTLYFDQFPDQDTGIFNDFLKKLHAALNSENNHLRINIMASHTALNTTMDKPFSYLNLSKQIETLNDVPKQTSDAKRDSLLKKDIRVLALIESPTTDSKKALRSEIEMALHGQARKRLLRDTIPVLEYDGHNWQQLNDDIIYFNDNFAGIAFWPLTVQADATKTAVDDAILKPTSPDDLLLTNMLSESTSLQSTACTFICPHRTEFRIGFISSLLVVLLISMIYLTCCSCRNRLKGRRYTILYWVIVTAPALLLLALSVCDPAVKHFVTTYALIICVLVCAMVYAISIYIQNRTNKPKP